MYWMASLTLYQPARIQRANLDGSQVEDLVLGARTSVGPRWSVALDVAGGKMYWADDTFAWGVRRANLDGSNLEKVVTTTAGEPQQLALDTGAGKMYWVIDSPPAKIQRANLDGSNVEDVVTTGLSAPGRLGLNRIPATARCTGPIPTPEGSSGPISTAQIERTSSRL
jgi:hypothetical protein